MEPYCSLFPEAGARLPHTNQLVHRVLTLPTGTAMTQEQISQVCMLIRFVVEDGLAISKKLFELTKFDHQVV
jgi:dTDP-4-amino-4,6-dideoxygalactose transaminase